MLLSNPENLRKYALHDENPEALANAIKALRNNDVHIVGFSGKKGSGKDTMAEKFKERFETDFGKACFKPFADSLKGEATSIIFFLHLWVHGGTMDNDATVLKRMSSIFNLPAEQAKYIFELLVPALERSERPMDGWTRTMEVWALLRYLGTEVRQPQDKYYWVRRTVQTIVSNANNGISTIVQDARFLHEADPLKDMGGFVARIDISPESQLRRLAGRDGVVPDLASLTHASETGLDDYPHFDIRVDNSEDGGIEEKAELIFNTWKESK